MMQHAAVVPDHDVAGQPVLAPDEPLLDGVRPEFVEQRFRFFNAETDQVRVGTTAQVERVPAGFRVRANERMYRSGGRAHIRDRRVTGSAVTPGIVSVIVL